MFHWMRYELGDDTTRISDYRFNTALKYQLFQGYRLVCYTSMHVPLRIIEILQSEDSYYARNEINRLTVVKPDGSLERPIPLGGILDQANGVMNTHNLRGQLNFNKEWQGFIGLMF